MLVSTFNRTFYHSLPFFKDHKSHYEFTCKGVLSNEEKNTLIAFKP